MQTVETKSLAHKFKISAPSTVEEFDKMAKKDGATLDAAVQQEIAHGTLGDVRDVFVALIEEETGIARRDIGTGLFEEVEGKRTEITKPEKHQAYYDRVCAEKGLDSDKEPFAHLAARISEGGDKEVKFDPSVRERKTPIAKLAKKYKDAAAIVIMNGTVDRLNENQLSLIGKSFTATGDTSKMYSGKAIVGKGDKQKEVEFNVSDKDAEALGWLYKQYRDWKEQQETADFLAS